MSSKTVSAWIHQLRGLQDGCFTWVAVKRKCMWRHGLPGYPPWRKRTSEIQCLARMQAMSSCRVRIKAHPLRLVMINLSNCRRWDPLLLTANPLHWPLVLSMISMLADASKCASTCTCFVHNLCLQGCAQSRRKFVTGQNDRRNPKRCGGKELKSTLNTCPMYHGAIKNPREDRSCSRCRSCGCSCIAVMLQAEPSRGSQLMPSRLQVCMNLFRCGGASSLRDFGS